MASGRYTIDYYCCPVKRNIASLWENQFYSDFTFIVEGEHIPVHKCVLASSSQVFADMFNSEMQEIGCGFMIIQDFTKETISELLRFIYTGHLTPKLTLDLALALIMAADKYDLPELGYKCFAYAKDNISPELSIRAYVCASLLNHVGLKNAACDVIIAHKKIVAKTSAWRDFLRDHVDLASELFHQISLKM